MIAWSASPHVIPDRRSLSTADPMYENTLKKYIHLPSSKRCRTKRGFMTDNES
jgi:hypothetical protein